MMILLHQKEIVSSEISLLHEIVGMASIQVSQMTCKRAEENNNKKKTTNPST